MHNDNTNFSHTEHFNLLITIKRYFWEKIKFRTTLPTVCKQYLLLLLGVCNVHNLKFQKLIYAIIV